jgi:hypothetical protein
MRDLAGLPTPFLTIEQTIRHNPQPVHLCGLETSMRDGMAHFPFLSKI